MNKWYYDTVSKAQIGRTLGETWQVWYGEKGFFKCEILFRKTINGWKLIPDSMKKTDVKTWLVRNFDSIGVRKIDLIKAIFG